MSYGGETGQMDTRAPTRPSAAARVDARETVNAGDDDGGE